MSNQPFKTLRDGSIKATIWENATNDGEVFYSVDFVRGYKDKEGNWQDSTSFSGAELLRVANLATQAYNVILQARQITGEADNDNASGGAQ